MRRSGRRAWLIWGMLAACSWVVMGGTCASPSPNDDDGSMDGDEPNEQLVFEGLNAALLSISGTSGEDVYAVGADPGDGVGPYVLHYDGQTWSRLETGASGDLWWISVPSINGVFFMAGAGGLVLRFDSGTGAFERFDTPGDDIGFGVWAADNDQAWVVGGDLDNEDAGGFIWRFDGNTWAVQNLSNVLPDGVPTLYKVWGRSADDVYAVGRLGVVLHFDGTDWSLVETDTTRTLFTVSGNASTVIAVGGFADAVIQELEGTSFVSADAGQFPQLNGVFVPPTGEAVAVGFNATIVRRADTGWELLPTALPTVRDFHAAWVDPAGGIWAVGGNLSTELDQGILAYIGTETISTTVAP